MSVLIKNMEMPKNCEDCDLADWYNGDIYCYVLDYSEQLYAMCPLVEVPTPHGRLIDADELREKMIKEADHYAPYIHEGIRHGYHNCELLVDDAPTIIESEK